MEIKKERKISLAVVANRLYVEVALNMPKLTHPEIISFIGNVTGKADETVENALIIQLK